MVLTVLLIIGLIAVLCVVATFLGLAIVGAGDNHNRNVISARRDWMNSHVEENE